LKDFEEDLWGLFGEYNINDELVEQNHRFIEKLNKKIHHKIKKPAGIGSKAS
jgi:hypothetical protein